MRNKWIWKVLSLSVVMAMLMVFAPADLALAAPVTTISLSGTAGDNGWFLSDVTVTLTATDNISGVSRIAYSFDNWYTDYTYTEPFVISAEGVNRVWARAWDNEGHMGESVYQYANIDRTMPYTSIVLSNGIMGDNGWFITTDIRATLIADDNVSGISGAPLQYSLNGGSSWLDYDGVPLSITNEGITTILTRARDVAGNLQSPPSSTLVKIDTTNPVVTETAVPAQIARVRKGFMVNVSYNGTAVDPSSGIYLANTELIDEYGDYSQNLGANLSGNVSVEAWSNGNDQDGRTYTFRLTATDFPGHQSSVEFVVVVPHP